MQVGADAEITGVTVRGGLTGASDDGGGIRNSGILAFRNGNITFNQSSYGGGVYNQGGTLTLADSTIANNTATGDNGGALHNNGLFCPRVEALPYLPYELQRL